MANARKRNGSPAISIRFVLLHPVTWFLMATLSMVTLAIQLWHPFRPAIVGRPEFRLTEDRIVVDQPPPWVTTDMKQLLVQHLSESANLLDPELVPRAAKTYQTPPWVEQVVRIEKMKSGLQVALRYRQPIALVELDREGTLQPIDRRGVAMDPAVLEHVAPSELLRISVYLPPELPLPGPWQEWHDVRVLDSIQLCRFLDDRWQALEIYRVVSWDLPQVDELAQPLELWTRNGGKVVWGSAPGLEKPGEARAEEKRLALESWIRQFGPLSKMAAGKKVDVRTGHAVLVDDMRTAQTPHFEDRF